MFKVREMRREKGKKLILERTERRMGGWGEERDGKWWNENMQEPIQKKKEV